MWNEAILHYNAIHISKSLKKLELEMFLKRNLEIGDVINIYNLVFKKYIFCTIF